MTAPNSAQLALTKVFGLGSQNKTDIVEASVFAALELMSLGSLVSTSSTPVADCLDYINANCNASEFTTRANQLLSSLRERA